MHLVARRKKYSLCLLQNWVCNDQNLARPSGSPVLIVESQFWRKHKNNYFAKRTVAQTESEKRKKNLRVSSHQHQRINLSLPGSGGRWLECCAHQPFTMRCVHEWVCGVCFTTVSIVCVRCGVWVLLCLLPKALLSVVARPIKTSSFFERQNFERQVWTHVSVS